MASDSVLDRAPCGFISFGDDSTVAYANATLLERLGYARADVVGGHVERILAVGTRIFYQTHFFPLIKLHGRAQEIFLLLRARDGEDVPMLCNALRRERGGIPITDCVLIEVQERRKFEEALLQARQSADEANKAKSNFLAVMSHELRTPLNAIGGYVQLLEMGVNGPVTPAQIESLGRIDRSQRHLLRLINDVLNLSRIEAGRVDYLAQPVPLAEVVASVIPLIEPQMQAKGLLFQSSVAPDLTATADREKVQQILVNLLTNAMKFTARDGRVSVDAGDYADSRVFIRVSDTGIGIPPEMLATIFEPFIQVNSSRSRSEEGTGLGLAISRDLARGMGGDLTATSELGVGTALTLILPVAR
jgi:PAS domain S-box-containing protein